MPLFWGHSVDVNIYNSPPVTPALVMVEPASSLTVGLLLPLLTSSSDLMFGL